MANVDNIKIDPAEGKKIAVAAWAVVGAIITSMPGGFTRAELRKIAVELADLVAIIDQALKS